MTDATDNSPLVAPRRPAMPAAGWIVLLVGVSAVAAVPALLVGPDRYDSCIFRWMGRRMLAGDLPYRDLWDNKLPVLYWLNEAAAATGQPRLALYLLAVAAIGGGGVLLFRLAGRAMGQSAAGLAALAYVTFAATSATLMTGNLTEPWAAPFVLLCLWAMVRYAEGNRDAPGRSSLAWPFASGLAMGAAVSFRQPALLAGAPLLALVPSLRRRGRLRATAVAAWLIGLAVAPAAMAAWAAALGLWPAMVQDCIAFNLGYGTTGSRPAWSTWAEVGRRWADLVRQTWPWHALALAGLIAMCIPRRRATAGSPQPLPWRAIALAWLIAAAASALPSLRFYVHHYYLALAPLALLSGWLWELLLRAGRWRRAAAVLVGVAAAAAVAWHINGQIDDAAWARRFSEPVREAGDFLERNAAPGETMFVTGWGPESDLLARLSPPSPTRHVMVAFYPELHTGPAMIAEWRDDMLARPPDWLVCREDADLVAGPLPSTFGWQRPDCAAVARQVQQAYRDLYVPAAHFNLDPADPHSFGLRIYRRMGIRPQP